MVRHCRRSLGRKSLLGALAGSWAVLLCACGAGNLLEPVDSSLTLLEFETRMLQVRYTDRGGVPVQGATCAFEIVGPSNGATLEPHVAVTDAQGHCRVNLSVQQAAAFKVVVTSDGADASESIPVSVSNDAGGIIEALVADNGAATVSSAEVRLVEDFDCSDFDLLGPPAPSTVAANPRQVVGITPGVASELKIFGLKANQRYSVLAIGYSGTEIISATCQQSIVISEEQITMHKPYGLTLILGDLPVDVGGPFRVTSQFSGELGLRGVAALLGQMLDSPDDPVNYVLSRMSRKNDEFVTKLITAHRPQLVEAMSHGGNASASRESLARVAASLASVQDIELHTLIEIADEIADETADVDETAGRAARMLAISHRFSHFTAEIDGHSERLAVSASRPVFDSTLTPRLEAQAELTVEDAEGVRISEHQMTVPMADAIVGKVLMDEFGDFRIDKIVTYMIDCGRAGELVAGTWPGSSRLAGVFLDPAKRMVVVDLCQEVVSEMVKAIYDQIKVDLGDYRWGQHVTFGGRAVLRLHPDGMRINRLVNGEWADLGTFSTRR